MRRWLLASLCLCTFQHSASAQQTRYKEKPNPWSAITHPVLGKPQAIGGYSNGCQQGAVMLPEQGEGYFDIRRFRNRFYTQPQTIELIRHIGKAVAKHQAQILIGDLSQPIGGLMSYAHVSHQNGLDADIYFASTPVGVIPNKDQEPATLVDKAKGIMLKERFTPVFRDALYAAATYPQTARIFVNPIIKKHLCMSETDKSWLYKIRPWGGHDSHFHVRLNCPENSPLCVAQAPIPTDDGCNADLDKWIDDQSEAILNPKPAKKPSKPKPRPEVPASCASLLLQAQQQ